jgi:hypothetical protein
VKIYEAFMKKFLFVLLFLFSLCFSDAQNTIKYLLRSDDRAVLLLDDNTLWVVYTAKQVNQSWYEWFVGVYPENPEKAFLCNFNDWDFFSKVELSSFDNKNSNLNKLHNEEIKNCDHLIKHIKTNTCAFAKQTGFEDYLQQVSLSEIKTTRKIQELNNKILQEYNRGYWEGRSYKNKEEFDRGFNQGYSSGYSMGYTAGFQKGMTQHY